MVRQPWAVLFLCLAQTAAVVAADTDPAPFRTTSGHLGFLVPGMTEPAGVRFLVNQDGLPTGWAPWGADRMSEGTLVFRYPEGTREWRWEGEGGVISAASSNTLALLLPNVAAEGELRWYAEWYDAAWNVVKRYPAEGVITNTAAALPSAPAWLDPPMPDLGELLSHMRPTLSKRAQRDYLDGAWEPVEHIPPLPAIATPGSDSSARVVLEWTDVATGARTELVPTAAESDGHRTRWRGAAPGGAAWFVVADATTATRADLVAVVQSDQEACFRLSLGLRLPEGEWTWFDDMQFSTPLTAGRVGAFDGPSPYGLNQRRSYYPFGVVATTSSVFVAESDGREPRHLQIDADGDTRTLRLNYDLAVTPATTHFPGLAAVRATFRAEPRGSVHPFRSALAAWYEADPDWSTSRSPIHGLWLPFTDVASISNAVDFQFAFFEKVGPRGSDVDAARSNGILNLIYTEPWLYWLPLASAAEWNATSAWSRMETLARQSVGKEREFASAGLLGVTRDAGQHPRFQFLQTPWSTGGRMEVITDPELPVDSNWPVNRAMAEWRFIREALDDPRVDGIYLDSMSAMETIDYNPQAIGVADHPCTFTLADLRPGLAMPIQAVEFTAALAGYLRANGKYLMANFPCWRFPFFMPYIDIPGEETDWYTGREYTPLSERERNYRRAMSGSKPFGFLQATHFSELDSDDIELYLRDCLALGLLPSFFSHDGANDPYWVDPKLYERDRPILRRYLPLTVRLSADGWQPVPCVVDSPAGVQVEQFGSTTNAMFWLTLRNTGDQPASGVLALSPAASSRVLYHVDSGHIVQAGDAPPAVDLEPGEVAVWLAVSPDAVPNAAAWFHKNRSSDPLYAAGAVNLSSLARESTRGLRASLVPGATAPRGEPVPLTLSLQHQGDAPASFAGWRGDVSTNEAAVISAENPLVVAAPPSLKAGAGRWASASWRVTIADDTETYGRMVRPAARAALVFDGPSGRIVATGETAVLVYSVSNRSAVARSVTLRLSGDLPDEKKDFTVEPGAAMEHVVELAKNGAPLRHVNARWLVSDHIEKKHGGIVVYAPPLKHIATQPGVRVTTDSAFSGYTPAALHDGIIETAGLPWYEAAFASAESADAHWVRVLFPSARPVTAVTAHWNAEGGVTFASAKGEVRGMTGDGSWVDLGGFDGRGTGVATRVEFESVTLRGIEWRQPPSSGSAARPDLLWLRELEIQ